LEPLLVHIIDFLSAVGPEVVFLMTLAETAFFIGLLIPAEATVLVASFLAADGVFELEYVLGATLLGALTGDQIGYLLGRYGGRRFAARGGRVGRLWSRYEPKATSMFRRHAAVAVTMARFVSFVRTLMPWFAGMTRMPYGRFLVWDVLGVLGWGIASVAAGFLARESWHVLANVLGRASAIVVLMLVVIAIVAGWRSRHASKPDRPDGRIEDALAPVDAATAMQDEAADRADEAAASEH
jgi:membrane-associated protein